MNLIGIMPLDLHSAGWAGLLMCTVQVFKLSFRTKDVQ